VLLALAHGYPYLTTLTDDTFVPLQFARNLIAGEGFGFNAGEPTYGAPSPLWVLLTAAGGAVLPRAEEVSSRAETTPSPAPPMPRLAWIAKGCGAFFLAASIVAMGWLGRRVGWSAGFALLPALLLAGHAGSARWAVSGLETPLAVLGVVLALVGLERALIRGKSPLVAGAFLGIASLARPECWLLAGLGTAAIAYGAERDRAKRILFAFGGIALATGPWLVAAWTWFQRVLPNAGAGGAGVGGAGVGGAAALRESIRILLSAELFPVALLVMGLAWAGPVILRDLPRARRSFWLLVAAWPVVLLGAVLAGAATAGQRTLLLGTPSVLLLAVASLRWVAAKLGARRSNGAVLAFAALFLAQNLFITFVLNAPRAQRETAALRASLVSLGLRTREHARKGARIAVPNAGAFGYYCERALLDLSGAVTPAMAPIASRVEYDAVVEGLLFETVARPDFLLDRSRVENRLDTREDPTNPYLWLDFEVVPASGLQGSAPVVYSLYFIRWDAYDQTRPRIAGLID